MNTTVTGLLIYLSAGLMKIAAKYLFLNALRQSDYLKLEKLFHGSGKNNGICDFSHRFRRSNR